MKHIDDLRIFLAYNPVDVLAINESKLDDSIKNCELYNSLCIWLRYYSFGQKL